VYFDHADKNRKDTAYFRQSAKATPNDLRGCAGHDSGTAPLHTSFVETASNGGAGSNLLRGGAESNLLEGRGGNDILVAAGGEDRLLGGPGDDHLMGGGGDDVLDGGAGADTIVDVRGSSRARTGASAGRGWDFAYVRDGRGDDTVRCDSRRTYVVADKGDEVRGRCGEVILRGPVGRPRLPVGFS
jgi:Ca2+-binding RTX toxin-like protein